MDYTVFAKDLLKRKLTLESAYEAMSEELCELEAEKTSTRSNKELNISAKGTNGSEDKLINLIYRIDDVKFRRGVVERDLKLINRGMSVLTDYEKAIILLQKTFRNKHRHIYIFMPCFFKFAV